MTMPPPSCPRCGYDMTGVMNSWRDSCPLDGRCSECGLEFSWSALLNPMLSVPRWSFEHTQRRLARCWAATAVRTARGRKFWAALRIEHPIRRARLWAFALLIILLAHAVCSLLMALYVLDQLIPSRATNEQIALYAAAAGLVPYSDWFNIILMDSPAWFLVVASMVMPLPFLVMTDTFRIARVRFVHLLRIWAYSQPVIWLITLASLIGDLSAWWTPPGPDLRFIPPALQLAGAVWLVDYWWRACRFYLQLPRSHFVVLAMWIIALLTATAWMVYAQTTVSNFVDHRVHDLLQAI